MRLIAARLYSGQTTNFPLLIGLILDLSGGMSPVAWGMSFGAIAFLMLVAIAVFWIIRPDELVGDKNH